MNYFQNSFKQGYHESKVHMNKYCGKSAQVDRNMAMWSISIYYQEQPHIL